MSTTSMTYSGARSTPAQRKPSLSKIISSASEAAKSPTRSASPGGWRSLSRTCRTPRSSAECAGKPAKGNDGRTNRSASSSQVCKGGAQALQFVRVAHGVDRLHLALGIPVDAPGLKSAIPLDDEQAVAAIEAQRPDLARRAKLRAETSEETHDLVAAVDRLEGRIGLAPAVGDQLDILGQHLGKGGDVSGLRGLLKPVDEGAVGRALRANRRTLLHDATTRPRSKFTACRRFTAKHGGNVPEGEVEDVMQKEGSALERRKPLQHQEQGDGKIVRQFRHLFGAWLDTEGERIDHGLRQPRSDIELAPRPRRSRLIHT